MGVMSKLDRKLLLWIQKHYITLNLNLMMIFFNLLHIYCVGYQKKKKEKTLETLKLRFPLGPFC